MLHLFELLVEVLTFGASVAISFWIKLPCNFIQLLKKFILFCMSKRATVPITNSTLRVCGFQKWTYKWISQDCVTTFTPSSNENAIMLDFLNYSALVSSFETTRTFGIYLMPRCVFLPLLWSSKADIPAIDGYMVLLQMAHWALFIFTKPTELWALYSFIYQILLLFYWIFHFFIIHYY